MAELSAMLEKKAAVIRAGDVASAADADFRSRQVSTTNMGKQPVLAQTAQCLVGQVHVQTQKQQPEYMQLRDDIREVKSEVVKFKTDFGKIKTELYGITDEIRSMKVGIKTIEGLLMKQLAVSGENAPALAPPRFFA